MTLPTSRNRTYTPGMEVPSADLNAIQDWIIETYRRCTQQEINAISRGLYNPIGDSSAPSVSSFGAAYIPSAKRWLLSPNGANSASYMNSSNAWTAASGSITNGLSGSGSIVYGGSIAIAAAPASVGGTQRHMTSTDSGVTYTPRTTPGASSTDQPSIGFNGSVFLMKPTVSSPTTYSSSDGVTWSTKGNLATYAWGMSTSSPSGVLASIEYYPSSVEAFGTARVFSTVDDGANWSTVTISGTVVRLKGIFYDSSTSLFFACGEENSAPAVWTASSPSGTWTKLAITISSLSQSPPTYLRSICRYSGRFVAVGSSLSSGYYISSDGVTWIETPVVGATLSHLFSTGDGSNTIAVSAQTATAHVMPVVLV